jgi:hypothetical protein
MRGNRTAEGTLLGQDRYPPAESRERKEPSIWQMGFSANTGSGPEPSVQYRSSVAYIMIINVLHSGRMHL